ncbi:MAG: O-Antigen ligase [Chthoniobacter sp.]|jgi:O-antigen ligase|nr:O-Antigen ligase [Chthoniobacter sp.]
MSALLLLIVVLCVALPAAEVAAALPAIWLAQATLLGIRAVLFTVGPVDLTLADLVLLVLLGKLLFSIVCTREVAAHRSLYLALAIFVLVNFLATLAGGVKFGGAPMLRGITALARLCSEMALVPILAQTVKSIPQARRCVGIVLLTLGALATIQFINFFGARHGLIIGEVQGTERDALRYFGPVGDSIGSVLLLGYLCALCFSSALGAGAFLGGILLTAGLGAIFSAGIGTVIFVCFGVRASAIRAAFSRSFWLLPALGFLALVAVVTVGKPLSRTLLDRLGQGNYANSGRQRMASVRLAGAMIADNPLTGVGYMGYEPALARYGGEKFFQLAHPDGATANANNQFLQSLTDAGLPGLLAFGWLIVAAARLLRELAAQTGDRFLATFYLGAFLWLLAQVFGNLAAAWLIPSSYVARLLWIILGTGIAVTKLMPSSILLPAAKSARPPATLVPA